jgi:tetratricopeptide (TPR) repeat protein
MKLQGFDLRVSENKSLEYMKVLKDTNPEDAGYLRNYSYTLISLAKIYLSENKHQRAIETLQQSKEISEKLYQSDRENGETIGDLAMIYDLLGRAYNNLGKRQKGLDWQEKSLVFYRKFLTKSPQNAVIKTEYIKAAALTSDNYRKLDMETNADKLLNESRRLWQEMRKRKTFILSETADIKKLLSRNG